MITKSKTCLRSSNNPREEESFPALSWVLALNLLAKLHDIDTLGTNAGLWGDGFAASFNL